MFEKAIADAKGLSGNKDAVKQKLADLKKQAEPHAQKAADQKALVDAANGKVDDPKLAQAYMSNILVANHADAAVNDLQTAKNKLVLANQRTADAQLAADQARIAKEATEVHKNAVDQKALPLDRVDVGKADRDAAEALRQDAITTANTALTVAAPAITAADRAREASDEVEKANKSLVNLLDDTNRALRLTSGLDPTPPPGTVDPIAYKARTEAAKKGLTDLAKSDLIKDSKEALDESKALAKEKSDAITAKKKDITDTQAKANLLPARKILTDPIPVDPDPALTDRRVSNDIDKAKTAADDAVDNAKKISDTAKDIKDTAQEQIAKANDAIAESQALSDALQQIRDDAKAAADQIPYDSTANAMEAKAAIEAAREAAKAAEAIAPICKEATEEIQAVRNKVNNVLQAKKHWERERDKALEAARKKNRDEIAKLKEELRSLVKRRVPKAETAAEAAQRKKDAASDAYKKAIAAVLIAKETQPGLTIGSDACASKAMVDFQASKQRLDELIAKRDEKRLERDTKQARLAALTAQLSDDSLLSKAVKAISDIDLEIGNIDKVLSDANDVKDEIETAMKPVKDLCDQAKKDNTTAQQKKDEAVGKRIEQLKSEGHGPQRHEGQVTDDDLRERAVFKVDPETHTQLDADTGELHGADGVASKLTSEETYVYAESVARKNLVDRNVPPGDELPQILIPLNQFGDANKVASGKKTTYTDATQDKIDTNLGKALKIPTKPSYTPGVDKDPPARKDMDVAAMRKEAKDHSVDADFTGGDVKPIYRRDVNGKVFLRTMWSQPAP